MTGGELVKSEPTIYDLLERVDKKKPDTADIKALRKALAETPESWRIVGDMIVQNTRLMFEQTGMSLSQRESILAGMKETRRAMGYEQAPMLEKMLIEHLLLCRLHLDVTTYKYTNVLNNGEMTLNQGLFWERRQTAAQRRYLAAVETLAKVRKLALPALQVNIASEGGQQVNIAGDLRTGKGER